jgi:excisionase family DNA binding protein
MSSARLLNIKEASEYLNIKESRLRASVFRREIAFVKIGRLVRFSIDDLEKYVKERHVKAALDGTAS